ncbi:hypothetical protein HN873_063610, partial [Arachis hypogaea]
MAATVNLCENIDAENAAIMNSFIEEQEGHLELPLFDLSGLANATGNFSIKNKFGEGGFGPVYK